MTQGSSEARWPFLSRLSGREMKRERERLRPRMARVDKAI